MKNIKTFFDIGLLFWVSDQLLRVIPLAEMLKYN